MRVGDAVDQLLAQPRDGFDLVTDAALQVLCAAYKYCAPEFYGGGDPCARQMSGEAIANVRASLVAALAAFDAARLRCPSGPMGLVVNQSDASALQRNVVPANGVQP